MPDRLMGAAEAALYLGISTGRLHQLRAEPAEQFPAPAADLRSGPVWYETALAEYAAVKGRRTYPQAAV